MNQHIVPSREPPCPYASSVRALCTDRLGEDEAAHLEEHITGCRECGALVDALVDPSDAVIQALASLPPTADDEPEFQRMAAQLLAATPGDADTSTPFVPLRLADPPIGPLPQTLGNYELSERIGRGAWGAVYRARHTKLDQVVAVKVLDTSRLHGEKAVDRFLQEMKAAGQLSHSNIVRATDAGEDRGFHYLVMEYIDGINVARLLQQVGPLSIANACEIVRQAAAALEFAHRCSWVHRDVKPSNLMVARDGTVKLLDLGVAGKHTDCATGDRTVSEQSESHVPLGTADYMAPEQWVAFADVDARADVFSLGCTLFRLLTGVVPCVGGVTRLLNTSVEIAKPSLMTQRRDVSRGLDQFVGRMLAPNVDERVESAAEVVRELSRWTRQANLSALLARIKGNEATPTMDERYANGSALPVTRRGLLVGGAVAAGVALLIPWAMIPPDPRLRRNEWRDLAPVSPALLAVEPDASAAIESQEPLRMVVRSNELALVQLGRSVSGVFSLEVLLQQEDWQGGAGVYFRGRNADEDSKIYEFQSVELRPLDRSHDPPVRRLLWSHWELTGEAGDFAARRDPWAETEVELADKTQPQKLQVTLGRHGLPDVAWNDRPLPVSSWSVSTEGRRQVSVAHDQLQSLNLGRLGLLNSAGATTFLRPRLSYR